MSNEQQKPTSIEETKFTDVKNAEASKISIRKLKETEKALQAEIKLTVWLPKKVIKYNEQTGEYDIPYWIIAKSIK